MQMPWILQSAVERELEGCPAQAVRAAALDLSRRYRESGRAPDGARLARSAEEVRAYAAFRMPATYAAVSRALEIAREAGLSDAQTLTDVGSGSGSAFWAVRQAFPALAQARLLEREAGMIALAKRLAAEQEGCRVEWIAGDMRQTPIPPADLVTASYCLGELRPQDAESVALRLWEAAGRALLQVELRRGGAPGDFVSFVLSCQQESPRAAHGRYSMELERRVLNAVSVGSREDVTRSVDEFLAECVLNQTIPAALSYGQMLYFEICRLIMERTGSFPAENAFFKRSWTQDGVYEQLAQALRRAALDAHELISTGKRRSSVVITAVNYIEQHYAEELTLGKIAEEIYVSPPYLSNIFKEKMDINLMSYIHKVRVEKAKKLLLESSLSIQKVAELVGYRHEKHFMQIFKKACGMTPSQFRFRKKE